MKEKLEERIREILTEFMPPFIKDKEHTKKIQNAVGETCVICGTPFDKDKWDKQIEAKTQEILKAVKEEKAQQFMNSYPKSVDTHLKTNRAYRWNERSK